MSLPEKDTYSKNKSWLLDRIKIAMGGYVAEKLIYQETSTGTKNDIEQATGIARRMVREWGMSEDLGFIAFGQEDEPVFLGKEIARHQDYSEDTSRRIDEEVTKIMRSCLIETTELLTSKKKELILLAEGLVQKETLDDSEVREILGLPQKDGDTLHGEEKEDTSEEP
jgi:cell division protease FtsH